MQPPVPQEQEQLPLLTLELLLTPPTDWFSQQGLQQALLTKSGKMMPLTLEEQELQAI